MLLMSVCDAKKIETLFGISNNELKLFKSYLTNREQVCSINDIYRLFKKLHVAFLSGQF